MEKDKDKIKKIKNDLMILAEKIEEWYPKCDDKSDKDSHQKAKATIELIKKLCKYCTIKVEKDINDQ